MKKRVLSIILILGLISILSIDSIAVDMQDEYDSLNFPEEKMEPFIRKYEQLKDKENIPSFLFPGDINSLIEKEGMIMIYHHDTLLKKFVYGASLSQILEETTQDLMKIIPATQSTNAAKKFAFLSTNEDFQRFVYEDSTKKEKYIEIQEYILDPQIVFDRANVTKSIDDIFVEKIYVLDDYRISNYDTSVIIYYETNHGSFVYYIDHMRSSSSLEFLFDLEKFNSLCKNLREINDFYQGKTSYYGAGYLLASFNGLEEDLSYYSINDNYSPDNKDIGYYLGVEMGYGKMDIFLDDLNRAGYGNAGVFLRDMKSNGYTTTEQYKAALEAAIEENNKDKETTEEKATEESTLYTEPSDGEKSEDKDNSYLYWLIPVAVVIVAAAIAAPVVIKKRSKK